MPSRKKQKNDPVPDSVAAPDAEDDNDDDDWDDEEGGEETTSGVSDAEMLRRVRRKRRNALAKARSVGYRRWAVEAGLGIGKGSFESNILKSAFSSADVARMARWCPEVADVGLEYEDFTTRLKLRDEALSSGPLAVLHGSVESFARSICKGAAMRAIESGSARLTAAHVRSVLRPFQHTLGLSFATPVSAIRTAQNAETARVDADGNAIPLVNKNEDDDEKAAESRAYAKENHGKALKEADAAKNKARETRRKKRARSGQSAVALVTSGV
jgi:hypothetical protein